MHISIPGDDTGTRGLPRWHVRADCVFLQPKQLLKFYAVNTLGWKVLQVVGVHVQLEPWEDIGSYGVFEEGSTVALHAQAEQRDVSRGAPSYLCTYYNRHVVNE